MGLEKIAELKREKKITTEELSNRSGVPLGTLNKILNGQTKDPKLGTLIAISKVLECTLDDFDDPVNHIPNPGSKTQYAVFDSREYTEAELDSICEFAEFLKSRRKKSNIQKGRQ